MDAVDCICLSLSVPRGRYVRREELFDVLVRPSGAHAGMADGLFHEVWQPRIAEMVRDGFVGWDQVVEASVSYGLQHTETARWAREMAGGGRCGGRARTSE